jgi:hypothetical protein
VEEEFFDGWDGWRETTEDWVTFLRAGEVMV